MNDKEMMKIRDVRSLLEQADLLLQVSYYSKDFECLISAGRKIMSALSVLETLEGDLNEN